MCGIFAHVCNNNECKINYDPSLLKHRGPDSSSEFLYSHVFMAHERLRLVGSHGNQPIVDGNLGIVLIVNGEIYNYKKLFESLRSIAGEKFKIVSDSDCAVLIYLYYYLGKNFLSKVQINGMYSFVLYDISKNIILIGRDHLGIIPLYYGSHSGCLVCASELKALQFCDSGEIQIFPPGTYVIYTEDKYEPEVEKFYSLQSNSKLESTATKPTSKLESTVDRDLILLNIREKLIKSVESHMMINEENKIGLLLSGGLDSSIIAAIAADFYNNKNKFLKNFKKLNSYCIGLESSSDINLTSSDINLTSSDLRHALKASKYINTDHHNYTFTIEEGLNNIEKTIWHIETYDVTTVRASIPMLLLAEKIRADGIKMVLSGEGADEIFGGYSYFKYAPNAKEFHDETVRKVSSLHLYDCLRANKSMMAHGIEARVPFLDIDFLKYAMSINTLYKFTETEKLILRDAFVGFLPDEILYRKKEQFSDGVGRKWISALKKHASDKTGSLPNSEAVYYKSIFDKKFKDGGLTVPVQKSIACSTETATKWSKLKHVAYDPSGYFKTP